MLLDICAQTFESPCTYLHLFIFQYLYVCSNRNWNVFIFAHFGEMSAICIYFRICVVDCGLEMPCHVAVCLKHLVSCLETVHYSIYSMILCVRLYDFSMPYDLYIMLQLMNMELFLAGEANVLAQFTVTEGKRKLSVAGCRCMKGLLVKKNSFKLVRDGEVLSTGNCVCVMSCLRY